MAFVGSSLKGLIAEDPAISLRVQRILKSGENRCKFRFLLTHPGFSEYRERQEDRPPTGIAKEILHAISTLR